MLGVLDRLWSDTPVVLLVLVAAAGAARRLTRSERRWLGRAALGVVGLLAVAALVHPGPGAAYHRHAVGATSTPADAPPPGD